jgi:hypothetical protein
MLVIKLPELTAYEFPEDAAAGQAALLAHWTKNPTETWLRAYAFTIRALAEAVIEANKTAPQHLYIDHSQCEDEDQLVLVKEMVAAGVEVTIGTSPAGEGFIAHTKAFVDKLGNCWEGSTNFSESAWQQVNTAFQFVSPEWRDMMIAAFNRDVAYAWTNEARFQLMAAQPTLATAA